MNDETAMTNPEARLRFWYAGCASGFVIAV
jgi:hypothetical protein